MLSKGNSERSNFNILSISTEGYSFLALSYVNFQHLRSIYFNILPAFKPLMKVQQIFFSELIFVLQLSSALLASTCRHQAVQIYIKKTVFQGSAANLDSGGFIVCTLYSTALSSLEGLDLVASVVQTIVQLVLYVQFKFGPGQYQI